MAAESQYARELSYFSETYAWALGAQIEGLAKSVVAASRSSIIGVGSGGSYTIASIICTLHEKYSGRISRPSTPLEIACNPSLASSSPAFFVSAEGKNPDIVEALRRAREHSSRAINVITNRTGTPLTDLAHQVGIEPLVFQQAEKDGYLATNSLLTNAVVVARAYASLSGSRIGLPAAIDQLKLADGSVHGWLEAARQYASRAAQKAGLIVIYSPALKPVAVDLESRLSESALLYCQAADLRSFAHGRHLWATERAGDCAILALVEKGLEGLGAHTLAQFDRVERHVLVTADDSPASLIAGLVAGMNFVSLLAEAQGKDPARPPPISAAARQLYYCDLNSLLFSGALIHDHGVMAKQAVLGAHWPHDRKRPLFERARSTYAAQLVTREYKAVIFDFDGTLCPSRHVGPPPNEVCAHLRRLIDNGTTIGIVSGRGDSMRDQLRAGLSNEYWPKIALGLYSGGWITDLETARPDLLATSEFLSHVTRIARELESLGVPIEKVAPEQPHQVSLRFRDGVDTSSMWFIVADAMRQSGLETVGIVRSQHSIDVLAPGTNKASLITWLLHNKGLLSHEILTIGDQGAWPGNDSSLLDHRYSLSVDVPSRRMDRGWKLAPSSKEGVNATLWYLDRMQAIGGSKVHLRFEDRNLRA